MRTARALVLVASACASLARADGPAPGVLGLEEVVVTARKLVEPLHEVPLAIDVIELQPFDPTHRDSLDELARLAPGLYFESLWGGLGSAPVLRGQSQPSTAGDNVGVFVDGVYQAERTAVDTAPIDVERVEIARGPQSALFGHSTFAGALHFLPRLPTGEHEAGATLGMGSDGYLDTAAYLSGPLPGSPVRGRLAIGDARQDGTYSTVNGHGSLGDRHRTAVAGMLDTEFGEHWNGRLSGRWTRVTRTHPASNSVRDATYDCGAVDPVSGYWSYYCGRLPALRRFDISNGIPDSTGEVSQALLRLERSAGAFDFVSETAYYRGSSDAYRDFDATSMGETFGVCTVGGNCPSTGAPPAAVTRLVQVNSVSHTESTTQEWTQEFRLVRATAAWSWTLGVFGAWATEQARAGFGFGRADLADDELLTVLLPRTPTLAGPIARANLALVDDPDESQRLQSDAVTTRRTLAAFGTVDVRLAERFDLRGELRVSRERAALDSRVSGFLPSFREAIEPTTFDAVTPRFSASYAPDDRSLAYVSAARGARSGGVNPVPGLDRDEQGYQPEFNWTYELGVRRGGDAWQLSATLFYIDWRDTQIIGFPTTPGVTSLITRNTAGVHTRGIEAAFDVQPTAHALLHGAWTYTAPEFSAGSDDPSSSGFCGLTPRNQVSSFCVVGPPRSGNVTGTTLVPYVDGNALNRAPQQQAYLSLAGINLPTLAGWTVTPLVDVSYQDDVYDRAINGARYGERTLLSARIDFRRGRWSVQAWGTNLTDETYIRSVGSRGPAFYPVSPRPLDLVYGDGRRLGVTVSVAAQ